MYSPQLETLTRKAAVYSIDFYQKQLSPRKGFACPHRLLYGTPSCSEHVKDLILHQDLAAAVHHSVQRFRDCAAAAQELRAQQMQGGCIVIPCCIPI